ncbi:hypothetical protein JL722_8073 [Aureococcus anophagefferens]|nr:hypothetical protein JL722_8073 [Aureococcus anophagefferens]
MLLLVMAAAAAAVSAATARARRRGRGALARRGDDAKEGARDQARPPRQGGQDQVLEEIFLYSMPIKEYQIVDYFFPPTAGKLKDEVMNIKPVQKQSSAGQRTRFKAYVAVGDFEGHIGLGKKCSSEVATAIRGALIMAKMNLIPIRRGYWGKNSGAPHTIPMKLSGSSGSVSVRLIPAPRGTGIVAAPASKKILAMAGLEDCYSTTRGHSRTTGNFITAEHTDFLSKDAVVDAKEAAY